MAVRPKLFVPDRIGKAFEEWAISYDMAYHRVDDELVWGTVKEELPPMREAILKVLRRS